MESLINQNFPANGSWMREILYNEKFGFLLLLLLNDSRLPFKVGLLVCICLCRTQMTSVTPVARASLSPCQHHRETILSQLGFKTPSSGNCFPLAWDHSLRSADGLSAQIRVHTLREKLTVHRLQLQLSLFLLIGSPTPG